MALRSAWGLILSKVSRSNHGKPGAPSTNCVKKTEVNELLNYPALLAKQVPPGGGHGYTFQAIKVDHQKIKMLKRALAEPAVAQARPFFESETNGWVMIKFMSQSAMQVRNACDFLASALGTTLEQGTFSRKELGLRP